MNTKKVKSAVEKNLKIAKKVATKKSAQLTEIAKGEYNKLKKQINVSPVEAKVLEQKAIKEYEKIKKQMETTAKKAEIYIKKNPAKAALVAAGIGAALAGAAAIFASTGGSKRPTKKKR